jgi:hypothetical protein
MTARHTPEDSVILSMLHSGSARYYGGRMTLRYDVLEPDEIDGAIDWLAKRGHHVYLLAAAWELTEIRKRFAGTRFVAATEGSPLARYREPGETILADISEPRGPEDVTERVTGVDEGLNVPGPVPLPRITFSVP